MSCDADSTSAACTGCISGACLEESEVCPSDGRCFSGNCHGLADSCNNSPSSSCQPSGTCRPAGWISVAPTAAPTSVACTGGKVYNECGSACDKTCTEPNPVCDASCVAKCECPASQPIWDESTNGCMAQASCPLVESCPTSCVDDPCCECSEGGEMMMMSCMPPQCSDGSTPQSVPGTCCEFEACPGACHAQYGAAANFGCTDSA